MQTLRILAVALAFASLAAAAVAEDRPRQDLREFPWVDQPVYRADVGRTGHVAGALVPVAVEEAWRIRGFNPGGHTAAKGSAAAVDGVLYIGSDDGTLHAIDAASGRTLWTAATEPSTNGIHGTPAVHGSLVLVGAYDGRLYAFDRATGSRAWATKLGDHIGSSPLVWQDRVYVSVETDRPSGILTVLDFDGNVLATDPRMMSHPHSSVGLDPALGVLAVGDNTGNLTAWDLGLGLRFVFRTGNDVKGPIAVADGSAYFGSWDHRVYRVDLATGEEVWSRKVPDLVMSGAALADGTVYIGSHDGRLYALDAEDGGLRWSYQTGGRVYGSPTVADGKVLVGSHDGLLHCVDAVTGERLWTHRVGGHVSGTPVLAGDGVVIAAARSRSHSGDLVMVRAAR